MDSDGEDEVCYPLLCLILFLLMIWKNMEPADQPSEDDVNEDDDDEDVLEDDQSFQSIDDLDGTYFLASPTLTN
jgi:hypothetical protein